MADPFKNVFERIRKTLFSAKFALEQDLTESERLAVVQDIRNTLDAVNHLEKLLLSPGNEENPLVVDTLSNSLANPFDPEPKTEIKEKK